MTPTARAELRALLTALRRLTLSTAAALADRVLSLDELVAIGCGDLPALVEAIADLVRPDAEVEGDHAASLTRTRVIVRAGRALVRRKRAAARQRKLRETRRVVAA